jgi:hypothetical protein
VSNAAGDAASDIAALVWTHECDGCRGHCADVVRVMWSLRMGVCRVYFCRWCDPGEHGGLVR